MKTIPEKASVSNVAKLAAALAMTFATVGAVNATLISQTFTSGVEGGVVTFDDTSGANQLRITFDNTSSMWNGAITGIVFNIDEHINTASVLSFLDGNGNAITGWQVGVDVNNNITPGNTVFDISFDTTGGINGGIYNDGTATDFTNVVPDIATLILTVTDPSPWTLNSIGTDSILRMQRTGEDGEGSLKIDTSSSSTSGQTSGSTSTSSTSTSSTSTSSSTSGQTSGSTGTTVPEPGMLALLGIGFLGQALLLRQRRQRVQ